MATVKVVAPGARGFTATLTVDETGKCVAAEAQLSACIGHERGALRAYFARMGWTATMKRAEAFEAPPVPPDHEQIPPEIFHHPMVVAILAAWPGATVRLAPEPA